MTTENLRVLIEAGENLEVEFKGEEHAPEISCVPMLSKARALPKEQGEVSIPFFINSCGTAVPFHRMKRAQKQMLYWNCPGEKRTSTL
jgi:hypothetical protein